MIYHIADRWLREEDLAAAIPGRNDPPEMVAGCITFLRGWHRPPHGTEEKTRNALVHARVQTASGNARIRELEQQVAQRDSTIDRLLAFVPGHAKAIPNDRQREIVGMLGSLVNQYFPGVRAQLHLMEEHDHDTEACHRVEILFEIPEKVSVPELVDAEVNLRREFIDRVSAEELRAITLLLEFRQQ